MTTRAMVRNPLTHPLDIDITSRVVSGRKKVFWWSMITIISGSTGLGAFLGSMLFDGVMVTMMTITGLGVGVAAAFAAAETFFFIRNDTTGMLVTQDMLASYQRKEEVNVAYGPGFHISYPWERRIAGNNISLEEATNDLEFEVLCSNGTLNVYGSYRLRPDMQRPVVFLNGVAAVADNISDLIKNKITTALQDKKVEDAVRMQTELNSELKNELVEHSNSNEEDDRSVETLFGVQFTDITISRMLPSDELQRTISAVAEAGAVRKAILTVLGVESEKEFDEKRQNGLITNDDVERARYAAMSMSGNLEGINVDRKEYVVSLNGVDSDAIKAVAEAAPAIATMLGKKGKTRGKPRSKSK